MTTAPVPDLPARRRPADAAQPSSASDRLLLSGPSWRTSSYSGGGGGNCVQVASRADGLAVRDSKNPTGGLLAFTPRTWSSFVEAVRSGGLPAV